MFQFLGFGQGSSAAKLIASPQEHWDGSIPSDHWSLRRSRLCWNLWKTTMVNHVSPALQIRLLPTSRIPKNLVVKFDVSTVNKGNEEIDHGTPLPLPGVAELPGCCAQEKNWSAAWITKNVIAMVSIQVFDWRVFVMSAALKGNRRSPHLKQLLNPVLLVLRISSRGSDRPGHIPALIARVNRPRGGCRRNA